MTKKIIATVLAFALGYGSVASAANLWELRDGSNVIQGNITDAATPVIEQMDMSGNAGTATALAADPADCSAGQFANAIVASGALSCSADGSSLTGVVSDTAAALASNPSDCGSGFYAIGIDADGTAVCSAVEDTAGGVDASTSAVTANVLFDHNASASVHSAGIAGNAVTATALAANPADCAANQFANTIAASGALSCAAIADADVPDTITVDLAATATALAANGGNCSAGQFAAGVDASGVSEGCVDVTTATEFSAWFQLRDTTVNICAATPGSTGKMAISTDNFDLYTSTGIGIGDWRNARTGVGPC